MTFELIDCCLACCVVLWR